MERKKRDATKHPVVCEGCGKTFYLTSARLSRNIRNCSLACRFKQPGHVIERKAADPNRYPVKCEKCGDVFYTTASKVANNRKFCSKHCQHAYFRKSGNFSKPEKESTERDWRKPLPLFGVPKNIQP
jgi:formylmethanofuran dehydrogenase subunit E